MNKQDIPVVHQQVYDNLPESLKEYFYIHKLWSGVSCIRLASGMLLKLLTARTEVDANHQMTFLNAAIEINRVALEREVWACTRFSNNGYQTVMVYLGTRNVDEFMRLSKERRRVLAANREGTANAVNAVILSTPSTEQNPS